MRKSLTKKFKPFIASSHHSCTLHTSEKSA